MEGSQSTSNRTLLNLPITAISKAFLQFILYTQLIVQNYIQRGRKGQCRIMKNHVSSGMLLLPPDDNFWNRVPLMDVRKGFRAVNVCATPCENPGNEAYCGPHRESKQKSCVSLASFHVFLFFNDFISFTIGRLCVWRPE